MNIFVWLILIVLGISLYINKKTTDNKKSEDRKITLIKKYGEEFGKSVSVGEVRIGMTLDMVVDALGKPSKIGEKIIKENYSKLHIILMDIRQLKVLLSIKKV